jgi:hypothetical protein
MIAFDMPPDFLQSMNNSSSHYEKEGRKACTKGRGSDNVKKRLTGRGREDV